MTDDEKKALIVAGAVAAIGLAIWLTRQGSLIPAGASAIQPTTTIPPGPGYTTYNVPPYNMPTASSIYPSPPGYMNDNNGCGCDDCGVSGGINTGNAPTSLTQLLALYQNSGNGNISAQLAATIQPFNVPPTTIADQIGNPMPVNSLF